MFDLFVCVCWIWAYTCKKEEGMWNDKSSQMFVLSVGYPKGFGIYFSRSGRLWQKCAGNVMSFYEKPVDDTDQMFVWPSVSLNMVGNTHENTYSCWKCTVNVERFPDGNMSAPMRLKSVLPQYCWWNLRTKCMQEARIGEMVEMVWISHKTKELHILAIFGGWL